METSPTSATLVPTTMLDDEDGDGNVPAKLKVMTKMVDDDDGNGVSVYHSDSNKDEEYKEIEGTGRPMSISVSINNNNEIDGNNYQGNKNEKGDKSGVVGSMIQRVAQSVHVNKEKIRIRRSKANNVSDVTSGDGNLSNKESNKQSTSHTTNRMITNISSESANTTTTTTTHSNSRNIASHWESDEGDVVLILYNSRYFVLAAYSLGYFTWSLTASRHVILATSYAKYYNISTEVSLDPSSPLGVDSITAASNIVVLFGYLIASNVVDLFGIRSVILGTTGIMLSSWLWYGAFKNFNLVFLAAILYSFAGPLITSSLLAISNNFFAETERTKATAIGTFMGLVGAGVSFIIGPLYENDIRRIDLNLKSCQISKVSKSTIDAQMQSLAVNGTELSCQDNMYNDAYDAFCCYTNADIDSYNLHLAILSTVVFVFSVFTVTNKPPTPPSFAAAAHAEAEEEKRISRATQASLNKDKRRSKMVEYTEKAKDMSLIKVLTKPQFMQLNLGDFFLTGGPEVVLATIARILPSAVAGYDSIMTAVALVLAIPGMVFTSKYLDRTKLFYDFTFRAYISATVLWMFASIGITVGDLGGGVLFIVTAAISIIVYIAWQVSGYELKMEYCYIPKMAVEGSVVGVDRIVVNISSVVFILAIPPERVGAIGTMWISFGFLVLGTIIVAFIPNKYEYRRVLYENLRKSRVISIKSGIPNQAVLASIIANSEKKVNNTGDASLVQRLSEALEESEAATQMSGGTRNRGKKASDLTGSRRSRGESSNVDDQKQRS